MSGRTPYERASDLGMDVAEALHHGEEPPVPSTPMPHDLWDAVMGDAEYDPALVPELRAAFNSGKANYW